MIHSKFEEMRGEAQILYIDDLIRSCTFKRKDPIINIIDLIRLILKRSPETTWSVYKFDMDLKELNSRFKNLSEDLQEYKNNFIIIDSNIKQVNTDQILTNILGYDFTDGTKEIQSINGFRYRFINKTLFSCRIDKSFSNYFIVAKVDYTKDYKFKGDK